MLKTSALIAWLLIVALGVLGIASAVLGAPLVKMGTRDVSCLAGTVRFTAYGKTEDSDYFNVAIWAVVNPDGSERQVMWLTYEDKQGGKITGILLKLRPNSQIEQFGSTKELVAKHPLLVGPCSLLLHDPEA